MMAFLLRIQAGGAVLSLQTLHGFGSNPKNPQAGLLQANDGNFYGATEFGGTNGENGTVFRITANGVFTSLFSFNGANGSRPVAGLVQATDGHLYGTTAFGGTNGDHGTIFRITLNGVFTPLFSFSGTNGSSPRSALVQGTDGSLYGTTTSGGANADNGTVFRITPGGVFTLLFSLPSNGRSGVGPTGRLIQASDGNFYGTTFAGGLNADNVTVFRITSAGTFTSLFSFSGANGSGPTGGLVRGNDGSFYGTTQFGGTNGDNGTVFKITANGVLTSLYSFRGPDGNYPVAGLVLGSDGNFYGTTSGDRTFGGTNTFGTVFRITPGGVLGTLSIFNSTNGASPVAALSRGNDGNFYGTTFEGGPGGGTVFRMVEPPVVGPITALSGVVRLTWSSFTNGTYRVEYKPTLNALSWTVLVPDVTAVTNRTSITNNVGGAAQRFYRVRLLP
jgi:uncharacterized repeat protein (TIGR03803 family)